MPLGLAMLLKNISQIFLHALWLSGRLKQTAKGAVLSVSDIRVSEAKRGRVPCRSVDNTVPSADPLRTRPAPKLKNVKRLTYEATPNSATVDKLCFQPAQAHPLRRYRRIHVL